MRDKYDYNYDPHHRGCCDIFNLVRMHDVELDISYIKDYKAFKITIRKDDHAYDRYLTDADFMCRSNLWVWDKLNHMIRSVLYTIEQDKKKPKFYPEDNDSSGLLEE